MNSAVDDIKARIDILDLIAEHVDLKRAGQNYKGLCPFHSEKTPSFMVSPSKQIFHCFGCNKGGDIFAFVMNYENMTFQETVSYLAQKAGINIDTFKGDSRIKGLKEGMFAIQREALAFFINNLKDSKNASAYIKERGLKNEIVEKFSLGYAKNEKDSLSNHLKAQGFPVEHIKASGLVNFGENGTYDFFRDRLMFPIFDLQGRTVAFGGRILSAAKNAPKYINSPDSVIFRKGELSYGLNLAKNAVTQKGYSIVVEGYLDVMMCHQYGFMNAVAPLGTALTSGQLKKLKRFSNKVLLIFDGDAAGVSATKRSIELCYAESMIVKILPMPAGEDPDTFLRRHGEDHFKKHLGRAVTPVDFLLKTSGKSKLDAVRHIMNLISLCPDPLQKDETIRELSEKSKTNELMLREELKNMGAKKQRAEDRGHKTDAPATSSREERLLLKIALSIPHKASSVVNGIDIEEVEDPVIKDIFKKIKTSMKNGSGHNKGLSIERLLPICSDEEQNLITGLSMDAWIDEEHADESIAGCFKAIALKDIERQIKTAGEAGDVKRLHSLLFEKKKITQGSRPLLKGGRLERPV
ncbi:MAG: DNA primase [Nitrospirae bacterium]|nr:DNA primase [Nitrospirota bacterium]MCL5978010.1 DNA primase [Nitrospirota bacterium]